MGVTGARHGDVRMGWTPVPDRCRRRNTFAQARNDAPDRPGDHRGIPVVVGRSARPAASRARLLVGTRAAHRDHAARPLDRDACARADVVGVGLARRAAARHRRADRRRRRSADIGQPRRPSRGRRRDGPARRQRACRWAHRFRRRRGRRVDGDRRVPAGAEGRRRPRRGRHRSHRLRNPRRGHRRRLRYRAGRHPAVGHRGAELVVAGPAARRPGRWLAVLVRVGLGAGDCGRLGGSSACRRRP
jgi:hypothetical protein